MRMKFWHFVICVAIICLGFYSGLMIYENNEKVSAIRGSFQDYSSSTEPFTYILNANTFNLDVDSSYVLRKEFDPMQEFNGETGNFTIKVNDGLCQNTVSTMGQVQGIYTGLFLNPDGSVALEDNLTVTVEYFLNQKTVLTIRTNGGSEAVSFWAQYISSFGMTFQVVEV